MWLRETPGINQGYLTNFAEIAATDPSTVVIKTKQPFIGMETLLSNDGQCNNGMPVSPAGLADPTRMGTETFGAGAYVIDPAQTVAGDHYTLKKNTNYWNPSSQHYSNVIVKVITDPNTAFQAVQTGQVDLMTDGPATLVGQAKNAGLQVSEGARLGVSLMLLDRNGNLVPALADVRVRQAIAHAIDRKAIAQILGESWQPLVQFGLPDADGYDEKLESTYSYDTEKAKQLLAEAGYSNGFTLPIADRNTGGAPDVTQALVQQLAAVGITATQTTAKDTPAFVAATKSKKNAAINFLTLGDVYFDTLRLVVPPYNSVLDPFGTSDPDINAAVQALSSASPADFVERQVEVNAVITKKAWFVNLASSPQFAFTRTTVEPLGKRTALNVFDILDVRPAGK